MFVKIEVMLVLPMVVMGMEKRRSGSSQQSG